MLSALVARSDVAAVVFADPSCLAGERSRCLKRVCGAASMLHIATSANRTVLESELALHRWLDVRPMIFNGYRGR